MQAQSRNACSRFFENIFLEITGALIAFSDEIALSFCDRHRILRNRAKASGASEREMEDGTVRQA